MVAEGSTSSLFKNLKAAKRLPSPPGTALKVLALCRNDDIDIQEIADVIKSDPALSGRLLKFANSPMAGLERDVTSVRFAVLMLGLRTVKLTALGFSLAVPESPPRCPGFVLKDFWARSFITAAIARRIAEEFFGTDREEGFTAGMLADIGQLALVQGIPDDYASVLAEVGEGTSLIEAERKRLGVDHVRFGAQLLEDWDLPDVLVQAVASQLQEESPDRASVPIHPLSQVVQIATRLAPVFISDQDLDADHRKVALDIVEKRLKLDQASWRRVSEEILTEYLQVAEVFDIQLESQASVMDLYVEAQEEAARVGMVAQLERAQAVQHNQDLLRRATTDALTGVANRAKFDERIEEAIKGLRRGYGDFALILFDIDFFKKFNDSHGHQVGDLVLKRVATTAANTLRDVDLLARYGGEEFVILAPQTDRKGACIVAARVRRCIEELQINVNGETLSVTVSLGLAITADHEVVPNAGKLIADADAQLYVSKQNGRNTWSYLGRTASKLS
ncbi:MAG: GGDEF domain-containing protein [Phycisphaerae bacterium]|nr:GGDEF domain-containing protein [Phycisphaerae bacterium]